MPFELEVINTGIIELDGGYTTEPSFQIVDAGTCDDTSTSPYYDGGDIVDIDTQMDSHLRISRKFNNNILGVYTDINALSHGILIHKVLDGGDL